MTGRLVADPELKETKSGKKLYRLRLVNNVFSDPDDYAFWFTATVYEDTLCFKMCEKIKKGTVVDITGNYSDAVYYSEKHKKYDIDRSIIVTAIYFADTLKDNDDNRAKEPAPTDGEKPSTNNERATKQTKTVVQEDNIIPPQPKIDDDLPF